VANGKYHKIKIELPNRGGYQVRATRILRAQQCLFSRAETVRAAQNESLTSERAMTKLEAENLLRIAEYVGS
jgi:hypothetical protein